MSFDDTIRMLAAGVEIADAAEWRRKSARVGWVRKAADAWRKAMQARDRRCSQAAHRLGEAEFQRLFEAEQAKVDRARARLDAVIERDRWPRHLFWGGI